jgi:hypothetical protein
MTSRAASLSQLQTAAGSASISIIVAVFGLTISCGPPF